MSHFHSAGTAASLAVTFQNTSVPTGSGIQHGGRVYYPVANNTIRLSTLTGAAGGYYGLSLAGNFTVPAQSNTFAQNSISNASIAVANGTNITSNTISGAGAAGISLSQTGGPTTVAANVILAGFQYGISVGAQNGGSANTDLWIGSNTIVGTVSSSNDTYGLYFNGLTSGATVHNNSIVYRAQAPWAPTRLTASTPRAPRAS